MNGTGHATEAREAQRVRIDDLEIDLRFRCLKRQDGEVELPHRVFELLLLLVAEPHVMHTRQRLLERIWSGLVVEDANLSQSVWMLRKALGATRKDWIRTVSKKGYVFEPPGAIEWLPATASDIPVADGPGIAPEARPDAAPTIVVTGGMARWMATHRIAGRAGPLLTVLLAMLLALGGLCAGVLQSRAPATATPRYVLIDGTGSASDARTRLPARLLEAWLGWKLASCPETRAATPAEWALPGRDPIAMIVLGSGALPGDDGRIFVQARIETGEAHRRIHREGARGDLARLVDEVSIEALQALLPARGKASWPALRVDPGTAERYLAFRDARLAHRWHEAATLGERLLRDAPTFELARLELGQTYAARGQLPQATALLDRTMTRLRPLPDIVRAQLQAYRLGLSPDHAAASRAYAALAAAHPDRPYFAIQQARALARTGRFADGLAVLDRMPGRDALSPELAVVRWTSLAGLRATAGDHAGARDSARAAARVAEAQRWPYERGHALMALANADVAASGGLQGSLHFDAAARAFDEAGDAFSALHARAIGELYGPATGEPGHLEPWLARARAAGQRQLELDALRIAAFHHYRDGDLPRYRERLRQAQALSETMGDRWGTATLRVDRLEDDFARGDRAAVDRGLARLAGSGLQGEPMLRARQIEAMAALGRGDFANALAALARGEREALGDRPGDRAASMSTALACTRAGVLVRQGRPAPARAQYARCRDAGAAGALAAAIGLAELEWLSGDREAARLQARQARELLPRIVIAPERWSASIDLAGVLVRIGDLRTASALLRDALPKLQAAGFRPRATAARIALAEVALAQGDTARAADAAAEARASATADAWWPRLRQVEVALARIEGDTDASRRMLVALDRDAHRRGDLMQQALAHRWLPADVDGVRCTEGERAALIARSGFRGANLDWLEGSRRTVPPTVRATHPARTFSRLD